MSETKFLVYIPDSVISERQGLMNKTEKVGLIARAAAIFGVEEVNIYHDELHGTHQDLELFAELLNYLLVPPYLRKVAFPIKEDFKYVGMLPPLNIESHLITKKDNIRFGYVIQKEGKFYVETGLEEQIELNSFQGIEKGSIIPIKIIKEKGKLYAIKHPFPGYSGFEIKKHYSLKQAIDKARSSGWPIIFTSKEGKPISKEWDSLKSAFKDKKKLNVFFGSPKRGLEEMLDEKYKEYGYWLNMVEGQKVKSVRTEEALYICLGQLNTLVRQINPENVQSKT